MKTFWNIYKSDNFQFTICSVIIISFFSFYSIAAALSEEEIEGRLSMPPLSPIIVDPYRELAAQISACEDAFGDVLPDPENDTVSSTLPGIKILSDDDEILAALKWQKENPSPPTEEDLVRWKEEDEADKYRRKKIVEKIKALESQGFDINLLAPIISKYVKKQITSIEAACELQDFFSERDQVENADYFYNVAIYYQLEQDNRWAATSLSCMYLGLYNERVSSAKSGDVEATSYIFYLINEMLPVLEFARYSGDDVFGLMIPDITKLHSFLVRRYISPKALIEDPYYGRGALASKVWAHDFGQQLVAQVEPFRILLNANHYKVPTQPRETDLGELLKGVGFIEMAKSGYQDTWVHPQGFTVRVKHKEFQFTIGYNLVCPIGWRSGTPFLLPTKQALASAPAGLAGTGFALDAAPTRTISDFQYNEIFKIVFKDKAIFIVPAFRNKDCRVYWEASDDQLDTLMSYAHPKLTGVPKIPSAGVGSKRPRLHAGTTVAVKPGAAKHARYKN